jgi:hypothetical protein
MKSISTDTIARSVGDLSDAWAIVAQCEGGVWYWFMPEGEVKVFRAAQDNGRIIATQGRVLDQPGMFWLYAKLPKSARPKPVHDYPAHATAISRSIA